MRGEGWPRKPRGCRGECAPDFVLVVEGRVVSLQNSINAQGTRQAAIRGERQRSVATRGRRKVKEDGVWSLRICFVSHRINSL